MALDLYITNDADYVGNWLCNIAGGTWISGSGTAKGLMKEGQLVSGVLFEEYNGANIVMHVAALPGVRWCYHWYLHAIFTYVFGYLGCKRATAVIAENNLPCLKLIKHLGFVEECVMKDAHPDGNLIMLVLRRDTCKWTDTKYSRKG